MPEIRCPEERCGTKLNFDEEDLKEPELFCWFCNTTFKNPNYTQVNEGEN